MAQQVPFPGYRSRSGGDSNGQANALDDDRNSGKLKEFRQYGRRTGRGHPRKRLDCRRDKGYE